EVDAGGECRRLSCAQTRAHLGGNGPRTSDRPTAANHSGEECLPALGGLVSENNGTDAIFLKYSAPLGEGVGHRILEPCSVLRAAVVGLRLVLHRLTSLRREWVRGIIRITQQRVVRERTLEPDEEEVREIRVWNRVVVRRVSEPYVRSLVRERVLRSIGSLYLSLVICALSPGQERLNSP